MPAGIFWSICGVRDRWNVPSLRYPAGASHREARFGYRPVGEDLLDAHQASSWRGFRTSSSRCRVAVIGNGDQTMTEHISQPRVVTNISTESSSVPVAHL